jgi:hypothetical protein
MAQQIRLGNRLNTQNYKFNSLKLKPFRTVVVGYTGQQQNPGIREWKFLQVTHEEVSVIRLRKQSSYNHS